MPWLIFVSFVWAFSFGLIKGRLAGIDASLVSLLRVALALLVFLPLLRPRGLPHRDVIVLAGIGAIQFGAMYMFYISAYAHLEAHEIAILSIFTPLFVCLIDNATERRLLAWPLIAAGLATIGAGVVLFDGGVTGASWRGIALMQLSNVCFAAGQIFYRSWKINHPEVIERHVFGLLLAGAVLVTLPAALPAIGTVVAITAPQWLTLAYLGLIASGLCFFLWNFGAARSGTGTLAVANNLKIPLAVACSLLVFGESADVVKLTIGGAFVVAAGLLAEWSARKERGTATAG